MVAEARTSPGTISHTDRKPRHSTAENAEYAEKSPIFETPCELCALSGQMIFRFAQVSWARDGFW